MKRWRIKVEGREISRFFTYRGAKAQARALSEYQPLVYIERFALWRQQWYWYQTFFRATVKGMSDE